MLQYPMVLIVASGQRYNVGEKPAVILYNTPKQRQTSTLNKDKFQFCYVVFAIGFTTGGSKLIASYQSDKKYKPHLGVLRRILCYFMFF